MKDEIPELNYARDALKILETSLELVSQGRPEFYRVAALQLRLLLCDTTRRHNRVVDISLARRLWPELRLNALNAQGVFDPSLDLLPLSDWLAQRLPPAAAPGITLRGLIRRICDQEGGAHVDLKPQAGLQGVPDAPGWVCKAGTEALRAIEALERSREGR